MYLKIRDKFEYMPNTFSNFETTGIMLVQKLRKHITYQEGSITTGEDVVSTSNLVAAIKK